MYLLGNFKKAILYLPFPKEKSGFRISIGCVYEGGNRRRVNISIKFIQWLVHIFPARMVSKINKMEEL